jgi:asparagine synthase (glutamine-hydrolysing)
MVELGFALPENQRIRRGQKFVLRQAMRGYLPELVRQRRTKTEFSEVLVRALESIRGERMSQRLYTEELGWVDGKRVRIMFKEMKSLHSSHSRGFIYRAWPLWMVCALELWFRAFLAGRDGAPESPSAINQFSAPCPRIKVLAASSAD